MKRAMKSGRKLITFLSVFSILATSIFSAFIGIDFTAKAETSPEVQIWGGYDETKIAISFDDGDGSAMNPYIITNGDQLFRMIYDYGKSANDEATYYKLGADIYLNDISNYDKWDNAGFDRSVLNNWYENAKYFNYPEPKFEGSFDGDGHYIYGFYAESYTYAAFIPMTGDGATVKNVHFRNSFTVNTANIDDNDHEGEDAGNGVTSGNRTWYDYKFGTASVLVGTVESNDVLVTNCSVRDAYVEASYFTSAIVGVASYSHYPTIKNCLVADVKLNATSTEKHATGVAGGIINLPYSGTDAGIIQDVICAGVQVYGASERDCMWSGYKTPHMDDAYLLKNVYSDVAHDYTCDHSSNGELVFTDINVNVVKKAYLKGTKAKEKLAFDWEYNWEVVPGDYPMPRNSYVIPTGDAYYEAGGPEFSEDVWDGTAAATFAAGTGTIDDPYLIENCEQFYTMVSTLNADEYYKIADGVTALYFNNVKGLSYRETLNVLKSKKTHIYAPGETNNFSGYFDGNGVTIYGIKSEGKLRSGIIPHSGTATLKNFTVKNSSFKSNDELGDTNSKTEGSAAVIADLAHGATVNLRNIAVVDCFVNSNKNVAGLVACSHTSSTVFIDDCIVAGGQILSDLGSTNHAAFVANSLSGAHTIRNCISLGVYPAADNEKSYKSEYINVYTDYEAPTPTVEEATPGITLVETNALKGTAVMKTAAEFDWENTWKAKNGIPTLKKHVSNFGTVGTAWSGGVADGFAGGDGSINNPYLIDTPERLAQMLIYSKSGGYYSLSANIYINDVSDKNWKKTAKQWITSEDMTAFTGVFDANGYTVYGLYNKDVPADTYAGLIPVLGSGGEARNVKVDNAYLSGKKGAYIGAVVGTVADNAINITALRAAEVGKDVVLAGKANAGGIVGRVGFTRLRMDNSIFAGKITATGTVAGLVGEVVGKLDIEESVSVGTYPFVSKENVNALAIYTDIDGKVKGVTVLETEDMIGDKAVEAMSELDFIDVWAKTDDSYPTPKYVVKSFNGVKGETWSGEVASSFAGGTGTEEDPYLIATGEQMALAISKAYHYSEAYFKLVCDIYLNDTSDELWTARVGCNSWFHNSEVGTFAGNFDGDGYVVFGLFYNYVSTPKNTYLGLFPHVGGSAVIKNLGISQAYIKAGMGDQSIYVGGIFGMGGAFYSFYDNKNIPADTVGDEFLVPGDTEPTKLPVISNCFVDHTCYIEGNGAGGIGCPGGMAVVIRDCIVTASVVGNADSSTGGLLGPNWANCSRVYNSMVLTQTDNKPVVGNQQWVGGEASSCMAIENLYYHTSKPIFGTTLLTRPTYRIGEEAKSAMPELDWENTWRVEEEGTPVLRVFDKEGRSGSLFSDKTYLIPDVKINFMTGTTEVAVESLVGKPYEKVTLPVPTREGYIFKGWHAFNDYSLLYPYEYFLARDINLYAEWEKNGIIQNFENYIYSMYDCDTTRWNYNKPGSYGGYDVKYAHTGTKSIELLNNSAESADLLLNYEEWLDIGQAYRISFWVATKEANNPDTTLSLVHNNWPDYLNTEVSSEPMVTLTKLNVGEWTKYEYCFVAETNWASIRATGNSSIYIDDVTIAPIDEVLENTNYIDDAFKVKTASGAAKKTGSKLVSGVARGGAASPDTGDNTVSVIALVSAIVSCAVIAVISKKNLIEVIEKN